MRAMVLTMMLVAVGCGAKNYGTITHQAMHVPKTARICIETPRDGRYGGTIYRGSGDAVAERAQYALEDLGFDAQIDCESHFRVTAKLKHWEDRATGWSMMRDEIEIELYLYAPGSQKAARTVTYKAIPNWIAASFTDLGQRKPVRLLSEEFDEAVAALVT